MMTNLYLPLFIFSYHTSFAFPTHRQKLTTQLTMSQSNTHSFDGQRDRISSDRIFFIETGKSEFVLFHHMNSCVQYEV